MNVFQEIFVLSALVIAIAQPQSAQRWAATLAALPPETLHVINTPGDRAVFWLRAFSLVLSTAAFTYSVLTVYASIGGGTFYYLFLIPLVFITEWAIMSASARSESRSHKLYAFRASLLMVNIFLASFSGVVANKTTIIPTVRNQENGVTEQSEPYKTAAEQLATAKSASENASASIKKTKQKINELNLTKIDEETKRDRLCPTVSVVNDKTHKKGFEKRCTIGAHESAVNAAGDKAKVIQLTNELKDFEDDLKAAKADQDNAEKAMQAALEKGRSGENDIGPLLTAVMSGATPVGVVLSIVFNGFSIISVESLFLIMASLPLPNSIKKIIEDSEKRDGARGNNQHDRASAALAAERRSDRSNAGKNLPPLIVSTTKATFHVIPGTGAQAGAKPTDSTNG